MVESEQRLEVHELRVGMVLLVSEIGLESKDFPGRALNWRLGCRIDKLVWWVTCVDNFEWLECVELQLGASYTLVGYQRVTGRGDNWRLGKVTREPAAS